MTRCRAGPKPVLISENLVGKAMIKVERRESAGGVGGYTNSQSCNTILRTRYATNIDQVGSTNRPPCVKRGFSAVLLILHNNILRHIRLPSENVGKAIALS